MRALLTVSSISIATAVGVVLSSGIGQADDGDVSDESDRPAPAGDVRPVPQELANRADGFPVTPVVGLVLPEDGGVDAAERVVRDVLEAADVKRVVTSSGSAPDTPVTIWLANADEVLTELDVESAGDLGAEGYLLAAGRGEGDRKHIVIDGTDADGAFYGAQTLRQLVQPRTGRDWMPGVEIRDWPAMRYRGLIEGFYGTPWSHSDRLRLMDFLGAHKMNTFEYAPKDDAYHRDRWRDPYPADKLAELGELIDRANANRVNFTFALSPGLSICYTSEDDFQALIAKFDALYELGARNFNIPLDDIDYNDWHCDADVERFGTGAGAAGAAQAYILNRVQREWVEPKGDVAPLEMVPTEYYNASESAYKSALREQMDENVVVQWTGLGVVPDDITVEQAQQAREVFGHEIVVWDNYPVNDYIAGRLPLAPYDGRENGLSAPLAGIISNPMNQAAVSEIALASFGDFSWNDAAYDPRESWTAALLEAANGNAEVADALEAFADLSWFDGRLHHDQSPALAGNVAEFWDAWEAGDTELATQRLRAELERYARADDVIRDDLNDDAFLEQADAWLQAADLWSDAMLAAVDVLDAQSDGDGSAAWSARQRAERLVAEARAIRDVREPHSSSAPKIGDGVIDVFVDKVLGLHDRWVGVSGTAVGPTTTMGTYASNDPAHMVDGDPGTYYWSDEAPGTGDAVGVDFETPREIGDVEVLMAKPSSPDDYIHDGVLEYSVDGDSWTELATGSTPEVRATAEASTMARYVRYRASSGNSGNWLVVREFDVEVRDDDVVTYQASGNPPAADGSSLSAAVDGRLDTSYEAARPAAAGEALTISASRARPVDRVAVLQGEDPVAATLQVLDADGVWTNVGEVTGSYAEVDVDAAVTDGFRLVWNNHEGIPDVTEVVPLYADVPPAELSVEPADLDLERGDSATLDVVVSATRPDDVTGQLTIDAPDSWTVTPQQTDVTVPRGGERTVTVELDVPTDAELGDAVVAVGLAADDDEVTTSVAAGVHHATVDRNVAVDGTATASSVEQDLDRLRAEHVNDADTSTRWASAHNDDAWVQVELPEADAIGKAVLRWEAAYGSDYDVQISADGATWTTVASVRSGDGGVDTVYLDDATETQFVRVQGVARATQWGYSLWELELYPVADPG